MHNQIETWKPTRIEILTAIRRCFIDLRAREGELTRALENYGNGNTGAVRCQLSIEFIPQGEAIEDTGAKTDRGVVATVTRLVG